MRRRPAGHGQAALDRDLEVHRLTARLRALRRFGVDACLGRLVPADGSAPVYLGRFGLSSPDGDPLLVDWRSPAAAPFFSATTARPMGLASRRRYRWSHEHVADYWDEVFAPDPRGRRTAPDDDSAFLASLGASRSPRMRDVLGTIQADQDAIIRSGSRGTLVVDGGPGTGKTVVALHRTAYLLADDPRLARRHGGVLVVGPSRPYLDYVGDVLPGLGEDGVLTCTLRDLVPEGASALPDGDPVSTRLKADGRLLDAVERAVAGYEQPPTRAMTVETPWADLRLDPGDWTEAFGAPEPGTPHNEARAEAWDALVDLLAEQFDESSDDDAVPRAALRRAVAQHDGLRGAFRRAWPLLDPEGVVADLWSVPAYLRRCAPWLTEDEVRSLQRPDARAWTVADLPFLDLARSRIGDPEASGRAARRAAELAAEREQRDLVRDQLIAADDSEMGLMSILRGTDAEHSLIETDAPSIVDPDELAGPFAHLVVDEAQELTDAQWRMLLRRCPTRSLTVVGDRAQARHGFAESWQDRLARVGLDRVEIASLTVNYRTPSEVMAEAEPVIRAALPDANVPTSIRSSGLPVVHCARDDLDRIVDGWLAEHDEGTACVIGDPAYPDRPRVRSLTPELAKGLEFDLVVLVDPDRFGAGIEGAVDRYVAMTRATGRLAVLTGA